MGSKHTPEEFREYFRTNYPGPDTIIHNPDWHAPKIYRAAIHASPQSRMEEFIRWISESGHFAGCRGEDESKSCDCGKSEADAILKEIEGGQ